MLQEIQNIILEEIHGIKNESEPGTNNELDHIVEIIVHINENLGERQRADLIIALEGDDGITAAEFCPLRCHLMLVRYDKHRYSSQHVLSAVGAQKLQARLIGSI
jgi:hypothetical protein